MTHVVIIKIENSVPFILKIYPNISSLLSIRESLGCERIFHACQLSRKILLKCAYERDSDENIYKYHVKNTTKNPLKTNAKFLKIVTLCFFEKIWISKNCKITGSIASV